jgi:CubicO group peptidase (beta-lactamase class C family)
MKKISLIIIAIIGSIAFVGNGFTAKKELHSQNQISLKDYWPINNWRTSTPEEQGMSSDTLTRMINFLKESGKDINSITIIRNGYLITDAYFYPFQKGFKHSINSSTKSVLSVLVGIAIKEGNIKSINDKVLDYFPDLKIVKIDSRKKNLTIRDLLTMSTGLDWEFSNNLSTNQMVQSKDWTQFVLDLPMKEEPGHSFNYCNGAAHLLSAIIQRSTGKSAAEFAAAKLQLGIEDAYWSYSPESVNSGYSGIYSLPTDVAKFGYLCLKKGKWNDKQIIPESWLNESTTKQTQANWTPLFPGYGYMWWINRFGGYSALGYGGQYIFVVPDLELVAVFTGGLFKETFYPGEIMEKYILASVKSSGALNNDSIGTESLNEALDLIQKVPTSGPVPPLSSIAKMISGFQYVFNNAGSQFSLFIINNNECKITSSDWGEHIISMDNVFRIIDCGKFIGSLPDHNHVAIKSRWISENTFRMTTRILEEGIEFTSDYCFGSNKVEVSTLTNLSDVISHLTGKLKK